MEGTWKTCNGADILDVLCYDANHLELTCLLEKHGTIFSAKIHRNDVRPIEEKDEVCNQAHVFIEGKEFSYSAHA